MTVDSLYLVDTNSFISVAKTAAQAAVKAGANDGGVASAIRACRQFSVMAQT